FDEVRPDVVLLDDGHQHLRMARQLNFVFFDSLMPMSRLRVAPLGHLREGPTALTDADMVVLSRAGHASREKVERLKSALRPCMEADVPFAEVDYEAIALMHDHASAPRPVSELHGRKVICVAGIASPASFFRLVDSL